MAGTPGGGADDHPAAVADLCVPAKQMEDNHAKGWKLVN
jgi:hypothetical protein